MMWPGHLSKLKIGDYLRSVRGTMPQEELSKISGYTQGFIAQIETGRRNPSAKSMDKIIHSCTEDNKWERKSLITDAQKIMASYVLKKYFKDSKKIYVKTSGERHPYWGSL